MAGREVAAAEAAGSVVRLILDFPVFSMNSRRHDNSVSWMLQYDCRRNDIHENGFGTDARHLKGEQKTAVSAV